jgi:hypothetical protein
MIRAFPDKAPKHGKNRFPTDASHSKAGFRYIAVSLKMVLEQLGIFK